MRKFGIFMSLILLMISVSFSEENLLKNGGFEEWVKYKITNPERTPKLPDGTVPKGWQYLGVEAFERSKNPDFRIEGAVSKDSEVKRSGQYSLKIENGLPTDITYVSQLIDVEPNTVYKISCWIKGKDIEKTQKGGPGVMIWFSWGPEKNFWGNQHHTGKIPEPSTGTFDWREFSFTVKTGEDAELGKISIQLRRAKGTVWYDDVKVVKIGETGK